MRICANSGDLYHPGESACVNRAQRQPRHHQRAWYSLPGLGSPLSLALCATYHDGQGAHTRALWVLLLIQITESSAETRKFRLHGAPMADAFPLLSWRF